MHSSNLRRVYCGSKLVKKIFKLTQKVYYMSANEVFSKASQPEETYLHLILLVRAFGYGAHDDDEQISYLKEKIDELYLHNLNTLKTRDIQDIIWVHESDKLKRAPKTIESLSSELMRRSLGDSQESDLIYLMEDSDVYKPYNIKIEEAASVKKCKNPKTRSRR